MIVNQLALQGVYETLHAEFNKGFEKVASNWEKVAMKIPSTSKENIYIWLSKFPKMRPWVGEKNIKSLEGFQYRVINQDYETTIAVDRNDIEDDQLFMYGTMAQSAGHSAKKLPDTLVFELVNGIFTLPCWDGQYFCDTDHEVAGASVSNKSTVPLSAASLAAAKAGYGAARTAMKSYLDDEGEPLEVNPNILLVPPALEDEGKLILTSDELEHGVKNPYKNTAELVVSPRITSPTQWHLLDTTFPIQPFIYQERKAAVFVQQTLPESDSVFLKKEYKYGAEARGAAGFGLWQMCFGSTGAGS